MGKKLRSYFLEELATPKSTVGTFFRAFYLLSFDLMEQHVVLFDSLSTATRVYDYAFPLSSI